MDEIARPEDPRARRASALLGFLFLFDVTLVACAGFAPGLWFSIFHGVPYVDPQGFLRRCAANWAAFALLQGIAFVRWKQSPRWLAIVAGVRLSDVFTDWTYLAFSQDLTWFGRVGLALSSPMNVICGLLLLRLHAHFTRPPER
ncbi:MAG: hypothetical protein ACAI25_02255 [Planctomycetota bacterium]